MREAARADLGAAPGAGRANTSIVGMARARCSSQICTRSFQHKHPALDTGTCGLVAMTSASHAEGRQFDPGQVYAEHPAPRLTEYGGSSGQAGCQQDKKQWRHTPGQDRAGDLQRVMLTS